MLGGSLGGCSKVLQFNIQTTVYNTLSLFGVHALVASLQEGENSSGALPRKDGDQFHFSFPVSRHKIQILDTMGNSTIIF